MAMSEFRLAKLLYVFERFFGKFIWEQVVGGESKNACFKIILFLQFCAFRKYLLVKFKYFVSFWWFKSVVLKAYSSFIWTDIDKSGTIEKDDFTLAVQVSKYNIFIVI